MKLRSRLVLALVAGALLPVLVAALVARPALTDYFDRYHARRRETALRFAEQAIRARNDQLSRAVAHACARDNVFDRLLATTGASEPSPTATELQAALGADELQLLRANGEVIASAPDASATGGRDTTIATSAQRATANGTAHRVRALRRPGETTDTVFVESACIATRGATSLVVLAGFAVDARMLGGFGDDGLRTRIVPAGERAARTAPVTTRPLSLDEPAGTAPIATLVVNTDDALLREATRDLNRVLVLGALFAACSGIALALLLAPRLSRPLDEVAHAADRIALGTRSVRIENTTAAGEAGRLVQAFNRMARNLDDAESRLRRAERVAAWRDIARQMAHEIKNPLTPIQMAVEMLRKARERQLPDFDELFDEQTRIVLEEVARLRRLVENFSRFARAPKPRPESVRIGDVITHVAQLQATAMPGVEITADVPRDVPSVRADREQLTQVLINLVANAGLATEERKAREGVGFTAAVHISARNLRDGRIAIDVDDNGPGIAPHVLERLFEPYVTTRQGRGGTGLGLAITHRIVTDHGGTITAETSPEGTRFEVVLSIAGPSDVTLDSGDELRLPT